MTAHDLTPCNGKMPLSEPPPHIEDPKSAPPPYTESTTLPSTSSNPARLHILGATWGGVIVTSEIRGLIELDKSSTFERLKLNMHTIHTVLLPDPQISVIKTLTVLYHYSDSPEEMFVLNATQFAPQIFVKITPTALEDQNGNILTKGLFPKLISPVMMTWRGEVNAGRVEILEVLYGPQRITTPVVMEELAAHLEGKRGQIRTTTAFFRADTWPGVRKSWTVYFRFWGSGGKRAVQCVTGMEDGALEVPWREE